MKAAEKPKLRRYFFDTEFNDHEGRQAVELISIGIVDEAGAKKYYGISKIFNLAAAMDRPWHNENVVRKLDHHSTWQSLDEVRKGVLDVIEPCEEIEFWAKNGSYDNVLLCQLFGGMGVLFRILEAEKGIKSVTFRDTKELLRLVPEIKAALIPMPESEIHIAIKDAENDRYVFEQCRPAIEKLSRARLLEPFGLVPPVSPALP